MRLGEVNDEAHLDIMKRIQHPLERSVEMIRSEFEIVCRYEALVMLIYQENHVLGHNFLRILLERERNHMFLFEKAITDGIQQGIF